MLQRKTVLIAVFSLLCSGAALAQPAVVIQIAPVHVQPRVQSYVRPEARVVYSARPAPSVRVYPTAYRQSVYRPVYVQPPHRHAPPPQSYYPTQRDDQHHR